MSVDGPEGWDGKDGELGEAHSELLAYLIAVNGIVEGGALGLLRRCRIAYRRAVEQGCAARIRHHHGGDHWAADLIDPGVEND